MTRMIIGMAVMGLSALASPTFAQPWHPPTDDERCPSKWGAGDERGAANHMSPETVLRAAQLIRTGEVFELGHVLSASMPIPRKPKPPSKPMPTNPSPPSNSTTTTTETRPSKHRRR